MGGESGVMGDSGHEVQNYWPGGHIRPLLDTSHSEYPTGIRLILSFHPTAVFLTHSVMVDVGTTIVVRITAVILLLLLLTIN